MFLLPDNYIKYADVLCLQNEDFVDNIFKRYRNQSVTTG